MENYKFTNEILEKGLSYLQYRNRIDELFAEGKYTGKTIKDTYLGFTELNIQRMNRSDKTMLPSDDQKNKMQSIGRGQIWVLLAEGWCGDCAQIIPAINKIQQLNKDKIGLKIFIRDDNDDMMNAFLTNGGRAIPKLILLDVATLEVLNTWGPRPKSASEIANHWKLNKDTITKEEFEQQLHLWYGRNRGMEVMEEIVNLAVEKPVKV
jgi:thiol-disulfide isomerase/thioredoxin